ncbi:ribonuclease E/G [Blastomonas sp.]|uniref:ribonuclease E/G n=1 Tax=Blastomonas sp. TaxID=1909299 RepID=UPI00406A3EA3
MAHWLYEDGIGEERAALIARGRIVEARIQRHDDAHAVGAVVDVKLLARSAGGHRARALLPDGREAMLQPVPKGASEGATIRAEIVREAMIETGTRRAKPPRLRPVAAETPLRAAPRLIDRLSAEGIEITHCIAGGPDRLAETGWHELIEEAETGQIAFAGGLLTFSPTPAMMVVDVDGDVAPRALALAAAPALAQAIRRHGVGGGIVIDFPALDDKADRSAVVEAFDAAMTVPCERTAINGFGLMQIVARRARLSLIELHAADPVRWSLLGQLRSAERAGGTGPIALALSSAESALLAHQPDWLDDLQRRTGRPVAVEARQP